MLRFIKLVLLTILFHILFNSVLGFLFNYNSVADNEVKLDFISKLSIFISILFSLLMINGWSLKQLAKDVDLSPVPYSLIITSIITAIIPILIFFEFILPSGYFSMLRDEVHPVAFNNIDINLLMVFIAMIILAPVYEELFFRGKLYIEVSNTPLGEYGAIALTSIVFALLHSGLNLFALTFYLFFSLIMVYWRWKCSSILPSIIIHSLYNTVFFLYFYFAV